MNGLFAMCEIALVSSKKSRLNQAERNGSKGAKIALQLLSEPEKFLSTVQIGITLVGIIAGAYGAEAFTGDLQPFVARIEVLEPYSHSIAFILIVSLITYFSLIIGELVPKTIALNNPEKITIALAPFMKALAFITYPVVLFLSYSTQIMLKMFFIKRRKDQLITEEELKYLIDTGAMHGTIEKEEGEMLHSVFRFGDQKAHHLMIYRKNINWLNASQSKEGILNDIFRITYTKYPVCLNSLDNMIGVISISEVLPHIQSVGFSIHDYIKPAIYFTEHTPALRILEEFRVKRVHIGFVVNEHGAIVGLITLHDLIENIVGFLPESDSDLTLQMVQRPDGSWLTSGRILMSALRKKIESAPEPQSDRSTLEEFIKTRLGNTVVTGSSFVHEHFTFEVMDMDGSKIDKVLVTRVKT